MAFLQTGHNLADLTNVCDARDNLGLASMAAQSHEDVNIVGGTIQIEPSNLVIEDERSLPVDSTYILTKSTEHRGVTWKPYVLVDWALSEIGDINLGDFSNNLNFVTRTEMTTELNERFDAQSSHFEALTAGSVLVNDLFMNNLEYQEDTTQLLTIQDEYGKIGRIGLESTLNKLVSVDTQNKTIPSMYLIHVIKNEIDIQLNQLSKLYEGGLVTVNNNLIDLSNPVDAVSNLGLNLSLETNDITTSGLYVKEIIPESDFTGIGEQFSIPYFVTPVGDTASPKEMKYKFFKIHGSEGSDTTNPISQQIFTLINTELRTDIAKRLVTDACLDELTQSDQRIEKTVESLKKIGVANVAFTSNYYDLMNRPIRLSAFSNEETNFIAGHSNLADLENIVHARSNLALAPIANTASWYHLSNIPVQLTDIVFNNVHLFLERASNLYEFSDNNFFARSNLGCGDIATQNVSNVYFTGGTAYLTNLTVSNDLYIKASNISLENLGDGSDLYNKNTYLRAFDQYGLAKWDTIPLADTTTDTIGMTFLTNEVDVSGSNIAPTSFALSNLYYGDITDSFNARIRNLVTSNYSSLHILSNVTTLDDTDDKTATVLMNWSRDNHTYLAGDETWSVLTMLSFDASNSGKTMYDTHYGDTVLPKYSLSNNIHFLGSNVHFNYSNYAEVGGLLNNYIEFVVNEVDTANAGLVPMMNINIPNDLWSETDSNTQVLTNYVDMWQPLNKMSNDIVTSIRGSNLIEISRADDDTFDRDKVQRGDLIFRLSNATTEDSYRKFLVTSNNEPVSWENLEFKDIFDVYSIPTDKGTWTTNSIGSNIQALFSNQDGNLFWSNLQLSHLHNVCGPEYTYQRSNFYNSDFELNERDYDISWHDIASAPQTGGNRRFLAINNIQEGWPYAEQTNMSFEYLSVRDIGLPYLVTNINMLSNNSDLDSDYGKYSNMKTRLDIEIKYIFDDMYTKDAYPYHFFNDFEGDQVRANYLSNANFDADLIMMSAPLTYLMIRSNMLEYSNEVTANYINDNREFEYDFAISGEDSLHHFVRTIIDNDDIVHAKDIGLFHRSMLRSNLDSMEPFEDFWSMISVEETDKPAGASIDLYNSNWIMYPSVYFAGAMASNITSNEVFKPYIRNDLKTYEGLSNLNKDYVGQEHTFVNLQTLSNVLFKNPITVDVDATADHLINKGLLDGFLTDNAGGHVLLNTTRMGSGSAEVATSGPSLEDLIFNPANVTTTSKIEDVANKKKLVNYETLSNYFYGHLLMPDGSTRIDQGWSNFDQTYSEIRRRVPRMDTVLEYLDHNNYLSNYNHRVVEPVVDIVYLSGGRGVIKQYNIHDTMSMTEESRLISTHCFSNYLFDTRPTPGLVGDGEELYTEMYDDDGNAITLSSTIPRYGIGNSLLHGTDKSKFKSGHGLLGFVVNSMDIINTTAFETNNPWEHDSLKPYTMVKHRVPSMREMSNYVAKHIDYAFVEKTGGATTTADVWDDVDDPSYLASIVNTVQYMELKTWNHTEFINEFSPHIDITYQVDEHLNSNVTLGGLRDYIRIGYYGVQEGYIRLHRGVGTTHTYPPQRVTELMTGDYHPHTSLLTVTGLSNFLYESGLKENEPFVLDEFGGTAADYDIASFNNKAHSYRTISARVFSNIASNLTFAISEVKEEIDTKLDDLVTRFDASNIHNFGQHEYTTLRNRSETTNTFVTDLSLRNYLCGNRSFLSTEIIDRLDSNQILPPTPYTYDNFFESSDISFVTPVGLSNILSHFLIENNPGAINLNAYPPGNDLGNFKIPSMKRLSNYIDFKTLIQPTAGANLQDDTKFPSVFRTSNMITDMINTSVQTKLKKLGDLGTVISGLNSGLAGDTDNEFGSIYLMSNLIHNAIPKISYDDESQLSRKDFRNTDRSALNNVQGGGYYSYDDVVPTVSYASNMINTIMLKYLADNFNVQQYDGVIDDNALFTNSMFSRTRGVFESNNPRIPESYIGSNTGNQTRGVEDRNLLSDFSMDGLDSDMFAADFSSMSTAEALAQDSEQTYASILSTKLLYEVMKNSDKLMHMGSIYRMMNDFYEIKRISTTNFNDLVTSRFYSDRILINSSEVSSDRSFITVGWNNDQPLAYSEEPIFEVNKDKSTMINGDLLLGKNKWMLSFDEDTLSIKKYDRATGRYVEKHVFT